jgi:hypothetical protein
MRTPVTRRLYQRAISKYKTLTCEKLKSRDKKRKGIIDIFVST